MNTKVCLSHMLSLCLILIKKTEDDDDNDDVEKDNDKRMIILDMHPCWQPQSLMDNGSRPLTKCETVLSALCMVLLNVPLIIQILPYMTQCNVL